MNTGEAELISARLDALGDKMDSQHEAIGKQLDSLRTRVKDVSHSLNGNGKPGLLTRTSLLEQRSTLVYWLMAAVFGAAVAAIARSFS